MKIYQWLVVLLLVGCKSSPTCTIDTSKADKEDLRVCSSIAHDGWGYYRYQCLLNLGYTEVCR